MKIKIDCKFLSNKGNGSKCKIGPRNGKKLIDCVFLKNGVPENIDLAQKEIYIANLLLLCKRINERSGQLDYFLNVVCKKIEKNFSP